MSSFDPIFKGPIEGYVVNYIHKHLWKVQRTCERDDLLQDAYVVFLRVKSKYPDLDTPQHFMALFKTAWSRHFTDLANKDTEDRVLVSMRLRSEENEDGDSGQLEADPAGDCDNDGSLAVMLRQAPREVTAVLNLFLSAPQELLDLALGSWNGQDKRCKAGGSARINKLLGLPVHLDALQTVHDYFH
jgi:hypothetical protein